MGDRKYRTDDEVSEALARCEGSITRAAELLGISRQSLHGRLRSKPYLKPPFDRREAMEKFERRVKRDRQWTAIGSTRPPMPRLHYSDKQIEELVGYLRGDVDRYKRIRSSLTTAAPNAIGRRRREIQEAVGREFCLPLYLVWPELRRAWRRLQIVKKLEAELERRREAAYDRRQKLGRHRAKFPKNIGQKTIV